MSRSGRNTSRSAPSLSARFATAVRISTGHRWFLPTLTGLAIALVLPSARIGLCCDDFVLLGILSGSSPLRDLYPWRLDVFNFFDGRPERMFRLLDLGLLPWWTFPGARVAFWRPVSALTHWLDYTMWLHLPSLMHVQSLLWFGGLVVTAGLMYRRLLPRGAAGVAALFYALDGAHAGSVTWVAGRNTILGALFGTLTLLLHDRWRRSGWRTGSRIAPGCFALALLSAEVAVATGAYLVAHAAFLDSGGWRGRLRALLPHGMVAALWQLFYAARGYGVFGAGTGYLDPVREPLQFARALAKNGPIFLLAQWTGPSSESSLRLDRAAASARWLGALVIIAVLAVLLAPLVRRDPVARFWTVGLVLAVVPICAGTPHDRYLFFVGLGAMGLLAQFLCGLLDGEPWLPGHALWKWPAVLLGCALMAVHLVSSPLHLVRTAADASGGGVEEASDSIPTDPAIQGQLVVIVSVPSAVTVAYSFFIRTVKGQPIPAHTRVLAAGGEPVRLYRADARTLRVRWEGPLERLFRGRAHPMTGLERIRLSGTDIEVTALTADGWPAEATFRFERELEDPALRWLRWGQDNGQSRFVSFRPPSIGETVLVR